MNGLLVFIEMKQKKKNFLKKNSKWPTQKKEFFKISNDFCKEKKQTKENKSNHQSLKTN